MTPESSLRVVVLPAPWAEKSHKFALLDPQADRLDCFDIAIIAVPQSAHGRCQTFSLLIDPVRFAQVAQAQ